jgi:hypothetical protein
MFVVIALLGEVIFSFYKVKKCVFVLLQFYMENGIYYLFYGFL